MFYKVQTIYSPLLSLRIIPSLSPRQIKQSVSSENQFVGGGVGVEYRDFHYFTWYI